MTSHVRSRGRVAVIGAGHVGSTFAYALLGSGAASEIQIADLDHRRAEGEAMDLSHGLPFVPPCLVRAAPLEAIEDVDLIVLAAGANQRPGESRLELVNRNVEVVRQTVPPLMERSPQAVLLVVTNPVDVLTEAARRLASVPPAQVIGSGTVLDSARFRAALADHCGVAPRHVHAYVVGEHGDSEVALWSSASVGGVRLRENCPTCGPGGCPPDLRERISEEVRRAAYRIIERKGATWFGIGLSSTVISSAVLRDERAVLTVSTSLNGEGVTFSLPCIVGRRGAIQVLEPDADAEELTALERSVETIRRSVGQLGLPGS
jgi:L-lactate dehydrogenase